jgi:hypothetical protein
MMVKARFPRLDRRRGSCGDIEPWMMGNLTHLVNAAR